MKLFNTALIMSGLLLCWVMNGYADRLYTWTDAKGRTHITQEPPPDTAKVVDTIDYSPQPDQPARRPAASGQPKDFAVQGNLIQVRKNWQSGDQISLRFDAEVQIQPWRDESIIRYGALLFCLPLDGVYAAGGNMRLVSVMHTIRSRLQRT